MSVHLSARYQERYWFFNSKQAFFHLQVPVWTAPCFGKVHRCGFPVWIGTGPVPGYDRGHYHWHHTILLGRMPGLQLHL